MENGPEALVKRFGANLRRVRDARGLKQSDVVARLELLGIELKLNLISKMENGNRIPDLPELLALSIALGVAPTRLFLSATARPDAYINLTPNVGTDERAAWEWASGNQPIPGDRLPVGIPEPDPYDFRDESRPHDPPDRTLAAELTRYAEETEKLRKLSDELVEDGVPPGVMGSYLSSLARSIVMRSRMAEINKRWAEINREAATGSSVREPQADDGS